VASPSHQGCPHQPRRDPIVDATSALQAPARPAKETHERHAAGGQRAALRGTGLSTKSVMLTDIRLSYAVLAAQLVGRALSQLCVPRDALKSAVGAGSWFATVASIEQLVLLVNGVMAVIGTFVFLAFYRHAVIVIGNRTPVWRLRPLFAFFQITKPLEMAFRFATAPLRCLPDVCIIGEVRCGTTTLSEHLRGMPGVHGPFCAFHHPLDGKESFYFSGHYFGFVHPYFYRAMFPLRLTRWAYGATHQPFLVFDGCAQYLTSPIAPALLRAAVGPDVPLLVCLREPVAQNTSWWRFEHASMQWFDNMSIPNSVIGIEDVRVRYPPPTFGAALALSRAADVEALYSEAERLALPRLGWVVPPRYLTWPNGQLTALARNGHYAANVRRWHRHFSPQNFEYFELSEFSVDNLPAVIRRLHDKLPRRYREQVGWNSIRCVPRHANSSEPLGNVGVLPSQAEIADAASYYHPRNLELFQLLGREYPAWIRPMPHSQHK